MHTKPLLNFNSTHCAPCALTHFLRSCRKGTEFKPSSNFAILWNWPESHHLPLNPLSFQMKWKKTIVTGVFSNAKATLNASGCITATSVCITMWPKDFLSLTKAKNVLPKNCSSFHFYHEPVCKSIQKEGKISEKIMVAYKRFQSKIGLAHIACVAPTSVC